MTNKFAQALGRKGGKAHNAEKTTATIKQKYGADHYKELGRKSWEGRIRVGKVFFKCPACGQEFETEKKLLAEVGECPKCNIELNMDNKVIIKCLTA